MMEVPVVAYRKGGILCTGSEPASLGRLSVAILSVGGNEMAQHSKAGMANEEIMVAATRDGSSLSANTTTGTFPLLGKRQTTVLIEYKKWTRPNDS